MTTIALQTPALWLPRHALVVPDWLRRPLQFIEGQFQPGQRLQFSSNVEHAALITAASVSFLQGATATNNGTSHSFASQSFGAAAADRYIIVAVFSNGPSVNSVTVGGVGASLLHRPGDAASQPEFWVAAVPTGTTGTISVSSSGTDNHKAIASWRVTGWDGSTLFDTAKNGTGAVADPSLSIDIAAGGTVCAVVRTNTTESFAGDWTGATERYNLSGLESSLSVGAADATSVFATTLNIDVNATNLCRLIAISLV